MQRVRTYNENSTGAKTTSKNGAFLAYNMEIVI